MIASFPGGRTRHGSSWSVFCWRREPLLDRGRAEWPEGGSVWWGVVLFGRFGWTAQGPDRRETDAEGITGSPCAPRPGDDLVDHTWSERARRVSDVRETGLTWLAIAIETNKVEHNRLDHATRSDDRCRTAQRASNPFPKNRFRQKRPWPTPAVCWMKGVPSRRTRPSRSGGNRARTTNASCGKGWRSCAWA